MADTTSRPIRLWRILIGQLGNLGPMSHEIWAGKTPKGSKTQQNAMKRHPNLLPHLGKGLLKQLRPLGLLSPSSRELSLSCASSGLLLCSS